MVEKGAFASYVSNFDQSMSQTFQYHLRKMCQTLNFKNFCSVLNILWLSLSRSQPWAGYLGRRLIWGAAGTSLTGCWWWFLSLTSLCPSSPTLERRSWACWGCWGCWGPWDRSGKWFSQRHRYLQTDRCIQKADSLPWSCFHLLTRSAWSTNDVLVFMWQWGQTELPVCPDMYHVLVCLAFLHKLL